MWSRASSTGRSSRLPLASRVCDTEVLALIVVSRLFDAVAARLQACRHCARVLSALRTIFCWRHATARLRRIKTGLTLGPGVTLETIRRLLFRRLPVAGVQEEA